MPKIESDSVQNSAESQPQNKTSINKNVQGKGRRWSLDDVMRFTDLFHAGTSWAEMAVNLGRTVTAVEKKAWKLGLERPHEYSSSPPDMVATEEWPEEDLFILREGWKACETRDQISLRLGRKKPAISKKIRQLGLPKRSVNLANRQAEIQRLYDAGVPASEIAQKFGVSKPTILKRVKHRRGVAPDLTANEKDIIEARWADGCTPSCIARRIRRRSNAVASYAWKMGLKDDEQDWDYNVRDLLDAGLSVDQVAIKLELPRRSIIYAIKRIRRKTGKTGTG